MEKLWNAASTASSSYPIWERCNEHSVGIECTSTVVRSIGFFVGVSSIVFWVCAQAPQLYLNWKLGNADSLAFPFLMQWLLGDITNLVGAILAEQTAAQIYTAVYFVVVDVLMVSQWLYYKVRNRNVLLYKQDDGSKGDSKILMMLVVAPLLIMSRVAMPLFVDTDNLSEEDVWSSNRSAGGRSLMALPMFKNTEETVGYVLGIISAIFYLGSRVPQIVKNFRRKSTGGLAFTMFVMAVLGNVTYSVGVFMHSTNSQFLLQKTPWLVGSMGTLCFDFTIFLQFLIYGDRTILDDPEQSPLIIKDVSVQSRNSNGGSIEESIISCSQNVPQKTKIEKNAPVSPLMFPAAKKQGRGGFFSRNNI